MAIRQPYHVNDKEIIFDESRIKEARKIIKDHNVLCNDRNHAEICKDLVSKLELLTRQKNTHHASKKKDSNYYLNREKTSTDINKREILDKGETLFEQEHSHAKLTDTCLLARLLKESYPHLQGMCKLKIYRYPLWSTH